MICGSFSVPFPMLIFSCIFAAYFAASFVLFGLVGKSLATAFILATVFSITLLVFMTVTKLRLLPAFVLANLFLIILVGAIEFYGASNPASRATRFGGRLSIDGHITQFGVASMLFDYLFCLVCNSVGVLSAIWLSGIANGRR